MTKGLTIMDRRALLLSPLLQCSRWWLVVRDRLDLIQQRGHVERLRDSWLMMGNPLSQKLVNHLHKIKHEIHHKVEELI